MQLRVINRIRQKELTLFFSSLIGYLFLGAFLAVTLFVFFWVKSFFARNIADVRPMFEALPVLLIFLSAAVTMRMWSEEKRSGTIEFVVTVPVSTWEFVAGKFLACWSLVALGLLLTIPLPITVSLFANLDWGPVAGGYLAAFLLSGAYVAIGLYVSARAESQIVSLIATCFLCGLLYLIGQPVVTDFVSVELGSLLKALGSGARFDSITRGVIDVRDLVYYFSLVGVFLALNVYALERSRWAVDGDKHYQRRWFVVTTLVVVNLIVVNIWFASLTSFRLDLTAGNKYSLSPVTAGYLKRLDEPLLIRGYFSRKTHPALMPLVPEMEDLLREYALAGGERVRVEIIDPAKDPEAENEANSKYGIRPVPFPVGDRYQSSLVNSYFDVLISYGDEYEVLNFRDLIEVKVFAETDFEVLLRNPEYDLTRSIKKVLFGFQEGGDIFANITDPVQFFGYVSPVDKLPVELADFTKILADLLAELVDASSGKFLTQLADPDAGDGEVAKQIQAEYGFQPMVVNFYDGDQFYFYLTLQQQGKVLQLPIPEALSEDALRKVINEGLKRFATGLLKTVGLVTPEQPPPQLGQQFGQQVPRVDTYTELERYLVNDFAVEAVDLSSGVVEAQIDLLMVIDAVNLDGKSLFAIDQFLMRGGTVVLTTGSMQAEISPNGARGSSRESGLGEWLLHFGIEIPAGFVMDPVNAALAIPVTREAGGFAFQEMVMIDYPYFVDVRDGLNRAHAVVKQLDQITIPWASPINFDGKNFVGKKTSLLASSATSWLSENTDLSPKLQADGSSGFIPQPPVEAHHLAVLLEGKFESFFKTPPSSANSAAQDTEQSTLQLASLISRSPESARLFVISSNNFLADSMLQMIGAAAGRAYSNSLQMMVNIVDWSLEDESLLSIRSRSHFNRTLRNFDDGEQALWETLNYGSALVGLFLVFVVYQQRRKKHLARYQDLGT